MFIEKTYWQLKVNNTNVRNCEIMIFHASLMKELSMKQRVVFLLTDSACYLYYDTLCAVNHVVNV